MPENTPILDQYLAPIDTESLKLPETISLDNQDMTSVVEGIREVTPDLPTNKDYAQADLRRQNNLSSIFTPTSQRASFFNEGFQLSDAYTRLSSGEYIPKFDNFLQGVDNEQRFALEQNTSEKWINGIGKFLGKTGTAVLGGTVGTLYGAGKAIFTADFDAVWDNEFQNVMDDWNVKMDYRLPNYYTQEERDKGFFGSLGTANFWANDFLGGLSFTTGAIASEAIWAGATGGTSLITAATRYGLRGANTVRTASNLKKAAKPFRDYISKVNGVNQSKRLGQATQGINTLRYVYTSAGYEAGVEARHYMNDQKNKFYSEFESINGRKPTAEEIASFESSLRDTANSVFATNLALVGSSNLVVFGKMFNIKNPLSVPKNQLNKTIFGRGIEVAEDGTKQAIKRNLAQRITGTTYSLLKVPVVEGVFEEGLQAVTSTAASSFLESSYNTDEDTLDLIESIYEGFSHTYGTKEGWKEVGLGMLIGLFGGGISSVGTGRSPFTNLSEAAAQQSKRDIETAEILNHYSSKKLVNEFFKINNLKKASDIEQKAEARGDIFGQESARTMGMLSNIVYGERMGYGDMVQEDLVNEVNNFSSEQLAENMGISVEEATELKEKVIEDYKATRSSYLKNRDFAEYVIGRGKIDKDEEINVDTARDMIAYQMTMAEKSESISKDFVKAIMTEVGDLNNQPTKLQSVLEVEDTLRRATKEGRQNFNNLRKQYKKADTKLKNLEKQRLRQEKQIVGTREGNQAIASQLNQTTQEIQNIQEELINLEQQLEQSYSALSLYTVKPDTEGIILGSDLAQLDKNIQEFDDYLKNVEQKNKPKSARIQKYLEEYKKSLEGSRLFGEIVEDLLNPETGLKGQTRTFITQLKEENNPTKRLINNLKKSQQAFAEGQAEIFSEKVEVQPEEETIVEDDASDIVTDTPFDTISDQVYERFVNTGEVSQITLGRIARKIAANQTLTGREESIFTDKTSEINQILRNLRQEEGTIETQVDMQNFVVPQTKNIDESIQELLKSNQYTLQNFGRDIEAKRPSPEEISEYEGLLSKLKVDPDSLIGQSASTISKRGLSKIGLTKEEITRYKDLNQKLSDWRVIDGVTNGETSLADLIDQKNSLKTEVKPVDLAPMETGEEVEVAVGAKSDVRITEMSGEMINTPDTVMVQDRGDKIHLTHIKIKSIVDKGAILKKDGNAVVDYGNLPNGIYSLDFATESISVNLVGHSRLEFTKEEFDKFLNNTNLIVIDTSNIKGSSWSPVYQRNEDGSFSPLVTDYDITLEGSDYNILDPQKLYDLRPGDGVFFKVSTKDDFNVRFEPRVIKAVNDFKDNPSKENRDKLEALKKEIYDKASIYIVNENNDVIGQLKAASVDVQQTENFKAIRAYTSNLILEKYDPDTARFDFQEGDVVDAVPKTDFVLPFTSNVTSLFIGIPNLNIEVSETNKALPQKVDFNEETIKMVDSFGIYENGRIVLNEGQKTNLKQVNTQFVKGLTRPTSIVVVNYKNQKIAYPISLKQSGVPLLDRVSNIIDSNLPMSKKAIELTKLLANNGIDPNQYDIKHVDIDNTFFRSENLDRLLFDLEGVTEAIDRETYLSKEFKKENLLNIGQITVNLENNPFQSPKIRIDLKTPIRFNRETEREEENQFDLTGVVEPTRIDFIVNEVASVGEQGLNAFNKKILNAYRGEIEKRVEEKLKLSSDKKAISTKEANKKCQ